MGAVTIAEMLALEAAAVTHGWTEEALLDLAGERLGRSIGRYFPHPGTAVGYLGKGHNAGDALIALRVLRDEFGWKIAIRGAYAMDECAALVCQKWIELGPQLLLNRGSWWIDLKGPIVLLDGLLGIGAKGRLREPLLALAEEMAWLRQHAGARVAAVDLPSGMDPDSGQIFPEVVTADVTFMIGNAKRGLLTGHAANATGGLALVPIEPLTHQYTTDYELISPQTIRTGKSPRSFDFHKGMAGRVAILAGSESYPGAAVLAATGALRGGGGLVTLFVPHRMLSHIAAKCPPEVIVRGFHLPAELLDFRFDSLVVGCGLGEMEDKIAESLLDLIAHSPAPSVIDADALNQIARAGKIKILTEKHLITPHPGEFAKLAPDLSGLTREEAARRFVDRSAATLLLKGCRTIVTARGHPLWCNSTGTPGMATGGQGDLLAGVIGARLASGDSVIHAAAISAWICGRSAEIALDERYLSEESLLPSDVLHFLGAAFQDWKTSTR